jgi:hypothetical protein
VQLAAKCMKDYIIICYFDCWFYWHGIGSDCNVLKVVLLIIGSEICTHHLSLSFVY